MKLPCLINVSLILIQASCSQGETWTIKLERQINTTVGSTVKISCSFTLPPEQKTEKVQVYWKKPGKCKCKIKSKDTNAFIAHQNQIFVQSEYKGKTTLIGNATAGDCSLMIQNITHPESNIYVRVKGRNDSFSFTKQSVSISLSGVKAATSEPGVTFATYEPKTTTESVKEQASLSLYLAIFLPLAAILVICLITGIVFFIKRKRSQSFTREESGYYVNFSRAPSDPAKREEPSKKLDNKELAEPKAIDDPVYINFEVSSAPISRGVDHTDNVYGNVDYS